jgi:histidine triad (HIT) family protein
MDSPDCLFCQILTGDEKAYLIEEDDRVLVVAALSPFTPGHLIAIPKSHSRNILDADPEDVAAAYLAAQRTAQRMRTRLDCAGVTIYTGAEPASGQRVMHFHIHILPRYLDDDFDMVINANLADHPTLEALVERLRPEQGLEVRAVRSE